MVQVGESDNIPSQRHCRRSNLCGALIPLVLLSIISWLVVDSTSSSTSLIPSFASCASGIESAGRVLETEEEQEPEGKEEEDDTVTCTRSSPPRSNSSMMERGSFRNSLASPTWHTRHTTDSARPPPLFSVEQHDAFDRDGFLVVSDLLDEGMLDGVATASHDFVAQTKKMKSYFSLIEMGMIFQAGSSPVSKDDSSSTPSVNRTITKAFRKVALESILPRAAAELMQLSSSETVRVLRDVFMSKAVDTDDTCDWHVDDVGFWPEAFGSEKEGINVWIALEDMPREFQGSMALSPGSHKAEWRHDAYAAIGLNLTFQGGFTKEEVTEMAQSGAKLLTTCEMKTQGPEVRDKIEATKWIPDIRKGDVIFATRSLFHRTVPVTPQGKQVYAKNGIGYLNRYSVRYVPGSARLPHGWTFEWSIKSNHKNEGSTLDSAMEERRNLLWYPRVWPTTDRDMNDQLDYLARTELDDMKTQTKNDLFELFALFVPTNNQ